MDTLESYCLTLQNLLGAALREHGDQSYWHSGSNNNDHNHTQQQPTTHNDNKLDNNNNKCSGIYFCILDEELRRYVLPIDVIILITIYISFI